MNVPRIHFNRNISCLANEQTQDQSDAAVYSVLTKVESPKVSERQIAVASPEHVDGRVEQTDGVLGAGAGQATLALADNGLPHGALTPAGQVHRQGGHRVHRSH